MALHVLPELAQSFHNVASCVCVCECLLIRYHSKDIVIRMWWLRTVSIASYMTFCVWGDTASFCMVFVYCAVYISCINIHFKLELTVILALLASMQPI